MARTILGVVVGYVAMFVMISAAFTGEYLLVGADYAFKPRTFEASTQWIATGLIVNLIISIIGGLICGAIAKSAKAVKVLAIVVFVLGLLLAVPALMVPRIGAVRNSSNVPLVEAMQKAEEPRWVPFTLPLIGVIGVLIGGKLKRRD